MIKFLSWGSARKTPISMQIFLLSRSTPSFPHAHFNQLLGAQSRKVDSSFCDATQIPPPNSTIKNIFPSIVVITFCTFGKIPLSVGPRKPTVDGTEGGGSRSRRRRRSIRGSNLQLNRLPIILKKKTPKEEGWKDRRRGREGSVFLGSPPPP